mmetsp:Transcript_10436/g.15689  ORF Transcript_10436/g.15689 Transcript_10436/m.15689 type:complete len:221 (+) Transcript_10436:39-701(+)
MLPKRLLLMRPIVMQNQTSLRALCTSANMDVLLKARKMSDNELIMHVDEQNRVIGSVDRKQMREKHLWHRASYVLVFNANNDLYVQKRVSTKDYCPGYLDVCTGGVVDSNEDNFDNAYRELHEEMGIDLLHSDTQTRQMLKYHGCFHYNDDKTRVWGNLFSCQWSGDIKFQETEVERVDIKSIDTILYEYKNDIHPYCPDSVAALYHYLACTRDLKTAKL